MATLNADLLSIGQLVKTSTPCLVVCRPYNNGLACHVQHVLLANITKQSVRFEQVDDSRALVCTTALMDERCNFGKHPV